MKVSLRTLFVWMTIFCVLTASIVLTRGRSLENETRLLNELKDAESHWHGLPAARRPTYGLPADYEEKKTVSKFDVTTSHAGFDKWLGSKTLTVKYQISAFLIDSTLISWTYSSEYRISPWGVEQTQHKLVFTQRSN